MKTVEAGVQKWQNAGRDPSEVARIMAEFTPLMEAGKVKLKAECGGLFCEVAEAILPVLPF